MNSAQWRGIIVLAIGLVLTAISGVILATFAVEWSLTRLLLTAVAVFLLIVPFFIYGIWAYSRHSDQPMPADEMTGPRELLNHLRTAGQADLGTLAAELQVSPPEIKQYIDDLSHLGLFCGIVNWEARVIALSQPELLESMTHCAQCKTPLTVMRACVTICPNCSTEYHLPEPPLAGGNYRENRG